MNQLVEYNITDAVISEMEARYMTLTISGLDDKEGYGAVHEARMVVKGKRIEVEKMRKELKADALAYGRKVDSEAKRIFRKLEPIESHLQSEESIITEEKKRVKEEEERKEEQRVQARIDELAKFECSLPFFDVAAMSDDEFNVVLGNAERRFEEEQWRKSEEDRQRKEKEESERLAREAEAKKLAEERAELDRIKHEQDKKNAELQAEHARIEAEKREIAEQQRLEVAKKEAAQLALKQEKEKRERDEQDRIEREKEMAAEKKRKEALKPDKEKLDEFAKNFDVDLPKVKSDEAKQILDTFSTRIVDATRELINNIDKWF